MKKIYLALISLLMVFSLYAQNVKSVGLSDSDVKNWAKNLNPIVKELQSLGVWTNDSINASYPVIRILHFLCFRKWFTILYS